MNKEAVNLLEKEIKNKDFDLKEGLSLLNDNKIRKIMSAIFEDKKVISSNNFNNVSSNTDVLMLLDLYAMENGITVLEEENDRLVDIENNPRYYYVKEIKSIPLYTKEEEKEAFIKFNTCQNEEQRKEIRKEIVSHNLRLVLTVANRINRNRIGNPVVNLDDFIQDGNMGLMQAVDRYDVDKGCRFSTMAIWWIYQQITRRKIETERSVRVPVYMSTLERKLAKEKEDYLSENCEDIVLNDKKIQELAEKYNASRESILLGLNKMTVVSIHNTVKTKENNTMVYEDVIADKQTDIEKEVMKTITIDQVRDLLETSNLSDRERTIIIKRFGLYGNEPSSRDAIAPEFNITRERVRQIENKTLEKLNIRARKRGITI